MYTKENIIGLRVKTSTDIKKAQIFTVIPEETKLNSENYCILSNFFDFGEKKRLEDSKWYPRHIIVDSLNDGSWFEHDEEFIFSI